MLPNERSSAGIYGRVVKNIGWQSVTAALRILVSVGALALLARLAGAPHMGLFGVSWVGPAIVLAVLQSGPAQALILIDDLTERHVAASYMSTILLGCAAAVAVALTAPFAEQMLGLAGLANAQLTAACFVPLIGLGAVDLSRAQRGLQFRRIAVLQTAATSLSSAAAITIAWFWDPIVGLCALQGLLGPCQFLLFRLSKVPIGKLPGRSDFGAIWDSGRHLLANSFTGSMLTNFPQMLLGTFLPAHELGLFTLSRRMLELIHNQVGGTVGQVLLPMMASIRSQPELVAETYLKTSRLTVAAMMMPLAVIITVPTEALITFGGSSWMSGGNVLLLLALMQTMLSLTHNVFWVLQAVGRASVIWKWNLAFMAWQTTIIVAFGQSDVVVAAGAMLFSSLVMPIPVLILSRYIPLSVGKWASGIALTIVPAIILATIFHIIHQTVRTNLPPLIDLIVYGGPVALAYIGLMTFLLRSRSPGKSSDRI